ncbi:MAG: glycosyl transferase family protein [Bryobacterales bacterium]|nr:glycosyl transferase family protein [Bryobacterales bacterium]
MPTEPILLEIAICTHNNAALLEKTLETLARQKHSPEPKWSVLVVDNASTDGTPAVVDRFIAGGRIPALRRVREAEQGLVPARLRAVQETTAPWLAFVDDDCLLSDSWVENALSFIESHWSCGAFGGIVRLDWEVPPPPWVKRYGYAFAEQEHGDSDALREWLVGAGLVLNRAALERSGWPSRQYLSDRKGALLLSGGDMEMVLRIRAAGYQLWYTPDCVIRHHIPARRTTLEYLLRINYGLGISQTWCDLLVWNRPYSSFLKQGLAAVVTGYLRSVKNLLRFALSKRRLEELRIDLSFTNGRLAGLRQIFRLNRGRRGEVLGCARTPVTGAT